MSISERYQKNLVTVAMGLRTERDIEKNGCIRFIKSKKQELINYMNILFKQKENLLILKIKKKGFRSEHINITNKTDLLNFLKKVDEIFDIDNEIWIITSSVLDCWRCRICLSCVNTIPDKIEMAFSSDDHVLDHITTSNYQCTPYILYTKSPFSNNYEISQTNLDDEKKKETNYIFKDILQRFSYEFKKIKEDLLMLNIDEISLDFRVNNGYDFHDFDVPYDKIKKVIEFYVPQYLKKHPVK